MSEQIVRPRRDVGIADHLWATFAEMAADMGVDRESLVSQALFAFARANGYAVSTRPSQRASEPPAARRSEPPVSEPPPLEARDVVAASMPPRFSLAPILPSEPPPARAGAVRPDAVGDAPAAAADAGPLDDDGDLLLRKAEALQRAALAESHPPTPPATPLSTLGATRAPSPSEAGTPDGVPVDEASLDDGTLEEVSPSLVLMMGGREHHPSRSERFLIGRAKHCDLIINSGKVSREHAVVVCEPDGWYIEDRQSSNGTWFDKERVTRRRIEDGDEYLVCEEKLVCRLR